MPEQLKSQDLIKAGPNEKLAKIVQKNLAEKRARQKEQLQDVAATTRSIISWPYKRFLVDRAASKGLRNKFGTAFRKLSEKFYNTSPYELAREQKPKMAQVVFKRAMPLAAVQGVITYNLAKYLSSTALAIGQWWWAISTGDKIFSTILALVVSAFAGFIAVMMREEGVWGKGESPKVFKNLRYVYYYLRLRISLGKEKFISFVKES